MKMNIKNGWFVIILIVLNMMLAAYATPITNLGDETDYIAFSKSLLGDGSSARYTTRSPLFSIIMAGFMLILKAPILYKVIVVFQYVLVIITAWLIFFSFQRLFKRKEPAMLIAILFNLSFSTIYFANILLTEILSVFLLVLSVHLLLRFFDQNNLARVFLLGIAVGLLALARFNAIPLIVTFTVLLGYILIRQKAPILKWIYSMTSFIFSYALIINLWCGYNYLHHGFYQLFPQASAQIGIPKISRNMIIASIRPENIVSNENKPVLEIFLKAREKFFSMKRADLKGSFIFLDKKNILSGLFSGYPIFLLAEPELKVHYKLSGDPNISAIASKLNSFIEEISAQNKRYVFRFRIYSLLNGFRASSGGSLPLEYGKINLNILPAIIFKIYKLLFLMISGFVIISFFFFIFNTVKTKFIPDITLLTLFLIVFSFWGINFVFITVGDANRFKFPAEPLIIGLFVYYLIKFASWVKIKTFYAR